MLKTKNMGACLSVVSAAIVLAGLAAYLIYGFTFDYFDIGVFAFLAAGAALVAACGLLEKGQTGFFNLAAAVCDSAALGFFFLNSFPVWADNLNGITMYASRGGLGPVIAIMSVLLLGNILEIVSCFMKGGSKNEA